MDFHHNTVTRMTKYNTAVTVQCLAIAALSAHCCGILGTLSSPTTTEVSLTSFKDVWLLFMCVESPWASSISAKLSSDVDGW